ncbi:hypothetical protein HY213_01260 [Candidatus Peregrinibacteria bacterium]|nr:hypothetical protein [Candidatus Peregrinibacteria bacterium]
MNERPNTGYEGLRFYGPHHAPIDEQSRRPINGVVLTSLRDIVGDDWVGLQIRGLVEYVTRRINGGAPLGESFRLRGIIIDDRDNEKALQNVLGNGQPYSVNPPKSRYSMQPWIHPPELRDDRGELLISNTQRIPSTYRSLPLHDKQGRTDLKREFEREVAKTARAMGADILISDHLIAKLEHNILPRQELMRSGLQELFGYGYMLNIHPAITNRHHPRPLRGVTPTRDAVNRANGFWINLETQERIPVKRHFWTGATLHVMSSEIDGGPVLCEDESTLVHPDDEPMELKERNYATKLRVFEEGIGHYARTIYDLLEHEAIDLDHLSPFRHVPSPAAAIDHGDPAPAW